MSAIPVFIPTVVLYGPVRCGKTFNAAKLRAYFGCEGIVDNWTIDQQITPRALHLTNVATKDRQMVFADSDTGAIMGDIVKADFWDVMQKIAASPIAVASPEFIIPATDPRFEDLRNETVQAKMLLLEPGEGISVVNSIRSLQDRCHEASYAAGWWHHPDTGLPYIPGDNLASGALWETVTIAERRMITHYWPFVVATKIALIHSEVSEGLEAFRRGAMDDKLSHRLGLETELADSLIRQFDIAGAIRRAKHLGVVEQGADFDLNAAVTEKMVFNAVRPNHKVAARRSSGGKLF